MSIRRSLFGGFSMWAMVAFNAEGGAGGGSGDGGGEGAGADGAKTPESLLYPNEKPAGEGDEPANGDEGAGDWKEYVVDPAKSDEENAAAKAEHDKTKPADDKAKKDDPADKVPEDGKYTLAMPDGVEVDQTLLDAVSPRFKELGLTTKQAQALTDDFIKVQTERASKQAEGWAETQQKWIDDAKADKEIGGAKFDTSLGDARRAINTLGTPALRDYLNASGAGNHPEIIRLMTKVGSMIKEDSPAIGGAEGRGQPVEPAHKLFPNDAPKG